jgi:hypothetical protein
MKKNLKRLILPLLMSLVTLPAFPVNDTIIIRSDESTELIERELDSLLNNWLSVCPSPGLSSHLLTH